MIIFRIYYGMMWNGQEQASLQSFEQAHTGAAFEVLHFRIYSSAAFKSYEDVLLYERPWMKFSAAIIGPVAIYLHHESAQTITLDIPEGSAEIPKPKHEGFCLLLEVYPHFVNGACKAFNVTRSTGHSSKSDREFQRNTFIIIGSDPSDRQKMRLRDKDVIKLGREKYVVRLGQQEKVKWYQNVYYQQELKQGSCRICLSDESSNVLDYLISPCNCAGSLAHVHIDCLRKWISNRIVCHQKQRTTTFAFQKQTCEVCMSDLPKFICIQGKMLELMPMNADHNSVLLQKIEFDAKGEAVQEKRKLVHCINREERETRTVFLGRSEQCQIKLEDSSVSRTHSKLIIGPDGVELYDCNSKYGTFVMLKTVESDLKAASYMSYKWRFELTIDE